MDKNKKEREKQLSQWMPFSALRSVDRDISDWGYKREYVEEHKPDEIDSFYRRDITGDVLYIFEPLEVKADSGEIFWRLNEFGFFIKIPNIFYTQFGVFHNHNNGEFTSWIAREGCEDLSRHIIEIAIAFELSDHIYDGKYVDMFDCGKYAFAISNSMHFGIGTFKILKLDGLKGEFVYNNEFDLGKIGYTKLEYISRFKKEGSFFVIASGKTVIKINKDGKKEYRDTTLLFKFDEDGGFKIEQEWNIVLSHHNSAAVIGDYAYFGHDKTVTKLNLSTGKTEYYTNKTDEELAALVCVR